MRGSPHQVRSCFLETETEGWRGTGQHVDPKHADRAERENTSSFVILEAQADNQQNHFSNISCEKVEDETLNVGKEAATFADCNANGVEVTRMGQSWTSINSGATKLTRR